VPDFLDEKVKEIDARIGELQDEINRLTKARDALAGASGGARRGPGRPRGSTNRRATTRRASGTTRRAGRPRGRRGGATRANQTLELVQSRPGITIPELASAMGIQPNYLYRVLPGLEKEGKIKRQGKGWHAAG
jgi:hypothetical protein